MSNNFRVGQKVVCVDAGPCKIDNVSSGLSEGAVYTIAAFCCVGHTGKHRHTRGIQLVEVAHPRKHTNGDAGCFKMSRFRPAVDDNEKLDQFRALLTPSALKLAKLDEALSPYPRKVGTPA